MRISSAAQEIQDYQNVILATEEALLEAICFDFVIETPHEVLVDLIERYAGEITNQSSNGALGSSLCDIAWNIAHDS
jgi:cyclin K